MAEKISIKSFTPGKRHSSTLLAEENYNCLILAGGFDEKLFPDALFELFVFNCTKQCWIVVSHFGDRPKSISKPSFVKILFAHEEFNSCGLLTLLVSDPVTHQFYILTLILALEEDNVSCLWTPVEGLTEYFKTANVGELRLELSLDSLG